MVENFRLLFQDVPTIQIDQYGSLRSWIHEASNEIYWCQLVNRLLYPSTPLPDRPNDWGPLPSWQAHCTAAGRSPTNDSNDSDDEPFEDTEEDEPRAPPRSLPPPPRRPSPLPSRPPPAETEETTYDPKRWLNDPKFCSMVGSTMSHSLKILGLSFGASEMEIKVHYRQLARTYHPDKNDPIATGLTTIEASDFSKLLNNANKHLKEHQ